MLALSLDVPFWPQLPHYSYHEDMYVQASENFPGIILDTIRRKLSFSIDRFIAEFESALARFDQPSFFDVSETYSVVYPRFLALDLSNRVAIRGQMEGPVSFGFNVLDQNDRPILFDDTIRPFLFEFMAKRVNAQLDRLKGKNQNAFMFVDEPGLQFIFSALSGYADIQARDDLNRFFAMIDRPRGIHLCGNPDWDFLFNLDLDVLSVDAYTNAEILSNYANSIQRFLQRDGILVWGLVPTNQEPFAEESVDSLIRHLEGIWSKLESQGLDRHLLIARSMLSPATCCLVNPDGTQTVDSAFETVKRVSKQLRDKYQSYLA